MIHFAKGFFCNLFSKVYILDGIFFTYVLPWYKRSIRGPHLPFEHLEEELKGKSGWPPIGDCKNNEIKIGEHGSLTRPFWTCAS